MEFRFRAGDRRGPSSSASGGSTPAPLSNPSDDYFGGPAGLPSSESVVARRAEIILEEVKRRLVEEDVRRDFETKGGLALAQGCHGGFGPDPFFAPGHFMPPLMPMPMHPPPHAPPPMPFEWFGAWQGFNQPGPRPHAGFEERMPFLCEEGRLSRPQPKPKHELLEIEPSGGPEVLSSKTKVPTMKRKADTIVEPTVPKKVQKLTKDWSCALCQVIAPCEAGLNEHLEGRKHKAKLAQCGASKAISDSKNSSQKTTGNKICTDFCDPPKKISMLVDGATHEVVQKKNYLWCDRCKVGCHNNVTMAGHLRGKKHSKLNKVGSSIEAVRTDTQTNEGLSSPCESKVNTNDCTEIPALIMGNIDMSIKVEECGPVENPVQIKKESTSMANEVESTNTANEEYEYCPMESRVETTPMKQSTDIKVEECDPIENSVQIKKKSPSMASEVESTNMATEVYEYCPMESWSWRLELKLYGHDK